MLFDRGPVPEAIELDAQLGLALFHQLEHELEERFSQTQPFSQEVLSQPTRLQELHESQPVATAEGEKLTVAQAMVVCRRFGRACPHGVYWSRLVQRGSELVGAPPANAPTAVRLAELSKLRQRLALHDLLEWAHLRGVLVDVVSFLESVPREGWVYME